MSKKRPLKVIAGTPDRPLVIGDIEIPCYVLSDETRVVTQSGMLAGLDQAQRGLVPVGGVAKMPRFAATQALNPFISEDLEYRLTNPIVFQPPGGGRAAYGYPATVLVDICEAVLDARNANALSYKQIPLAERCELLLRGFAKVGIIALVDEATGYQAIRDRKALQDILDKYLLAERAKWAKRFPDSFYKGIFRLRGWQWQGMKVNRPQVVGHYTNDIVWDRLAPGVRKELEKLNPKDATGNRRSKHHQYLTPDIGHPALQQHLIGVIALMNSVVESTPPDRSWNEFKRRLQRVFPKVNTNLDLPLDA